MSTWKTLTALPLAVALAFASGCTSDATSDEAASAEALSEASVIPVKSDKRFSDSHLYTPDFHLFQDSIRLDDLKNRQKVSMTCGPTSLAHAMRWQRLHRPEGVFKTLSLESDLDDNGRRNSFDLIRHFVKACNTTKSGGNSTGELGRCTQAYYRGSGFRDPITFMIGPAIMEDFPQGTLPKKMQAAGFGPLEHTPTMGDVRKYLGDGYSVTMLVGWYRKSESGPHRLERAGGHFFNVYGYNFDRARPDKMQLKVVNSSIDYTSERKSGEKAFDMVEMKPIRLGDYAPPAEVKMMLADIEGESTPFFGPEETFVAGVDRLLVYLPEEP